MRTPLKDFLGDRRESLKKELDEVSRERLTVERKFQQYRKKLADAEKEILALIKDLEEAGKLEKVSLVKKAEAFAKKIREDAERVGSQELSKTKYLLREATLAHALDLARESLQKSVGATDQERLIAWGIKNLEGLVE